MARLAKGLASTFVLATLLGCPGGPFGPTLRLHLTGHWINAEDPPTPLDGCVLHFTTSQTGESTHLGAFTGTGATCIPAPPQQLDDPPHFFYDPAPPYFVAAFENEMVWTVASGDELWLSPNAGVFVQSLATGQVSVLGTLQVSGGTGRFDGASGELDVRSASEDGLRLDFDGVVRLERRRR